MATGEERVSESLELAEAAGRALERMVAGSESTQAMISDIAAAAEQQSTTSEEMARSVVTISSVASESADGLTQIAQSTEGLSDLTGGLRDLIARFETGTSAPSSADFALNVPSPRVSHAFPSSTGGDGSPVAA